MELKASLASLDGECMGNAWDADTPTHFVGCLLFSSGIGYQRPLYVGINQSITCIQHMLCHMLEGVTTVVSGTSRGELSRCKDSSRYALHLLPASYTAFLSPPLPCDGLWPCAHYR